MINKDKIKYTKPCTGFWTIPKVPYGDELATYNIFEKMTYKMNQSELPKYYNKAKKDGNPYPTDAILLFSILDKIRELEIESPTKEIKNLKDFLYRGFQELPSVLSKVIYSPSGKDKVIHNYNTNDKYSYSGNFLGESGLIEDSSDEEILKLVFGKDKNQINNISNWINNAKISILRAKVKPERKVSGVGMTLDNVHNNFWLSCDRPILLKYPSFRVQQID